MTANLSKLTASELASLAAALRSGRLRSPYSAVAVERLIHRVAATEITTDLAGLLKSGFNESQTAIVLEALGKDRSDRKRVDELVDLVTTGPENSMATNRDTGVVVRGMFVKATSTVMVVGYAVYQGQRVFQTLAKRMTDVPELRVEMFLDIQRSRGDSRASGLLVREFAERFTKHQWPADSPQPSLFYDPRSLTTEGNKRSSLHAKCVVVDQNESFISSANFTEAAQQRNIEVGVLVRSQVVAKQLTAHFAKLRESGDLQPIGSAGSTGG